MEQRTRIRINLAQRELEVEGSEPFVERYAARIGELLDALAGAASDPLASAAPAPATTATERPAAFGEFLQRLPGGSSEVDRMLAAGLWIQQHSTDDAFTTLEANRMLTEHGVKLGNPSQCVKQSQLAKRVFTLQRGRYRVSQQGRAHLRQLMGAVIPE